MDDDDMMDLHCEAQWQRRRDQRLNAAPNCNDPDHPGCSECMEEPEDD